MTKLDMDYELWKMLHQTNLKAEFKKLLDNLGLENLIGGSDSLNCLGLK